MYEDLNKLGYNISSNELEKKSLGQTTQEAILDFQRQHGLPPTGIVDDTTASAIEAALEARRQEPFIVSGLVRYKDGSPLGGLLVRAFDKDLRSEKQLGEEATTDRDGRYEIYYSVEKLKRPSKKSADLLVRAFSSEGSLLAESDILFNAPAAATINLIFSPKPEPKLSEYEKLLADLTPALESVRPADLTDEDIAFLAGDTGIDRKRIELLRLGSQLSRETDLPSEVFYALAQQNLPLKLDELLAMDHEQLVKSLQAAIDENIVPASLHESLESVKGRLEQLRIDHGFLLRRKVTGRLIDKETGEPLSGLVVHAFDLDAGGEPRDLGYDITTADGLTLLAFVVPKAPPETVEKDRRLRLQILDRQGKEICQTEIIVKPDEGQVQEIKVALPPVLQPPSPALIELAEALKFELSQDLQDCLAKNNIQTLADIRRSGGIGHLEGLPVAAEDPVVRRLEAHADLTRLSSDVQLNDALIQKGFDSVYAIANSTRSDFVAAVGEKLGDLKAAQMHVVASAETNFLNSMMMGIMADSANGYKPSDKSIEDAVDKVSGTIEKVTCRCRDCEAAVSPLAYLADLLDYTLRHLKRKDVSIELPSLSNEILHQPLGDLPASCELMDKQVRQARICIEVLRSRWPKSNMASDKIDQSKMDEASYCLAAYEALLEQMGTSYDEIRRAHATGRETGKMPADEEMRKKLADRLGIDLGASKPDHLDAIYLEPKEVNEKLLERFFGLQDTERDPLSDGPVIFEYGDEGIIRWNLEGVELRKNNDQNGLIYGSLRKKAHAAYHLELFRDNDRKELVASGEGTEAVGTIIISENNQSGLSGRVNIRYLSDSDFRLSAVPLFTTWRLEHLRTLWKKVDWPDESLPDGSPVIDPDIIGPDDFRNPDDMDMVFALWKKRREWVDGQIKEFENRKTKVEFNKEEFDEFLGLMYQDVIYGAIAIIPWKTAPAPEDFGKVLIDLTQAADPRAIEKAKEIVEKDLFLTIEAFTRMMAVRNKYTDWKNHETEKVSDEEWREIYSILVQAVKKALFSEWNNEEHSIEKEIRGVLFDPRYFWISVREPREGDWPPVIYSGRPLIDPESIPLADLPDQPVGKEAIKIWQDRQKELQEFKKNLKVILEDPEKGFNKILETAIGKPSKDLDDINKKLVSADPNDIKKAENEINYDLHMSVEAFTKLIKVKAKLYNVPPAKPTAAEWAEIYSILTTSWKVKYRFERWCESEADSGMDAKNYWRALKARLPKWLATSEARRRWQQALLVRDSAPIIDPDLINENDLKDPFEGRVLKIWKDRRSKIDQKLEKLKEKPAINADFEQILKDWLQMSPADLSALNDELDKGVSIKARLEQLRITSAAFSCLIRVLGLYKGNMPVLDSEWEDVQNILVQVWKRSKFSAWRREEKAMDILLCQDCFQIPEPIVKFPREEAAPLPAWRATIAARRNWQDMLQSRIDQEATVREGLRQSVSSTEEGTLPALRNALIEAIDAPGINLEAKAKWITDHLLIDARAGGCQKTTRISQAIESVQGLLWSVRTGQLADAHPELKLDAENFDNEWEWIGSYATWRAAMFIFIYPENVLLPSLRKHKTPAFRKLIESMRSSKRLTPGLACEAAMAYYDYFSDIAGLDVQATCQTRTRMHEEEECRKPAKEYRNLFYMFAMSTRTNTVYWSVYDPSDPNGYAQTFWAPVQGLENVKAIKIVGAVPYERTSNQRLIYLFVLTQENGKLKLIAPKYDLEAQRWTGTFIELELPAEASDNIIAVQTEKENEPPEIGVLFKKWVLYKRPLNNEGNDWAGMDSSKSGNNSDEDDWNHFKLNIHITYVIKTVTKKHTIYKEEEDEYVGLHGEKKKIKIYVPVIKEYTEDVLEETYIKNLHSILRLPTNKGTIYCICFEDGMLNKQVVYGNIENNNIKILDRIQKAKFTTWIGSFLWKTIFVFYKESDQLLYQSFDLNKYKATNVQNDLAKIDFIVSSNGYVSSDKKHIIFMHNALDTKCASLCALDESKDTLFLRERTRIIPITKNSDPLQIPIDKLKETQISDYNLNKDGPLSNLAYLEEAHYFVPIHLALQLQQRGHYPAALDWFRRVFDYSQLENQRKVYYGFDQKTASSYYQRGYDWLQDPLNPHAIAAKRSDTYLRYTKMAIIRCMLDYADAEFAADTAESIPRAWTLYSTALELLEEPELKQMLGLCEEKIGDLTIQVGKSISKPMVNQVAQDLSAIKNPKILINAADDVMKVLIRDDQIDSRLKKAKEIIEKAKASQTEPLTFGALLEKKSLAVAGVHMALQTIDPAIGKAAGEIGLAAGLYFMQITAAIETDARDLKAEIMDVYAQSPKPDFLPAPAYQFCIPPNPVLRAFRLRAELNLYKIRTCRNIAGMVRDLDPYAAPTDVYSGMPAIGAGGQLVLQRQAVLKPVPYRYFVLIERAKQIAHEAATIEAAMLSTLEKRDAESLRLLEERQKLRLARAGVRLQQLRVKEAEDTVELHELQREKAQIEVDTLEAWIEEGLNEWEQGLINAYQQASEAQIWIKRFDAAMVISQAVIAAANADISSKAKASAEAVALAASAMFKYEYEKIAIQAERIAHISEILAAKARREQEWNLRKTLAEKDVDIASQNVTISEDQVRVVEQERTIAELQVENAEAVIDFLTTKFTNIELYDWMSDILERVYSFFLQQATSIAKLAENQLAFERQEVPPQIIQDDYWEAPSEEDSLQGRGPERRGLTGSARLLQDIYQLDQYAFDTNKRKLQISKTFSLARLDPYAFQRFRETGIITFRTPMELFNRDFPGHYLRLIKRVRTSVVALIPPNEGIHATLTTTGLSRVVIGGDFFQTIVLKRSPELVALSSPISATGLFEMEAQSEMLNPFEGMGVDTTWEFRMPKAANLVDNSSIADVLITLEYTALSSFDYYQQVIFDLDCSIHADRPFSFRNQFPDQWYDLHNPDQTETPMVVRFKTGREDFPPNIEDLKISQLMLYFARKSEEPFEVDVTHLQFTESGKGSVGGGAKTIDGVISTQRGNAGDWTNITQRPPIGEWELALPNTEEMKSRFENEEIEDILYIITFKGRTPEWPKT